MTIPGADPGSDCNLVNPALAAAILTTTALPTMHITGDHGNGASIVGNGTLSIGFWRDGAAAVRAPGSAGGTMFDIDGAISVKRAMADNDRPSAEFETSPPPLLSHPPLGFESATFEFKPLGFDPATYATLPLPRPSDLSGGLEPTTREVLIPAPPLEFEQPPPLLLPDLPLGFSSRRASTWPLTRRCPRRARPTFRGGWSRPRARC